MRTSRIAKIAMFLAAVAAVERIATQSGAGYLLTQLTMSAYYTLVALGLSLLMGYAGQVSLGHAGFFAIGGYTSAFLTTWDLSARRGEEIVATLSRLGLLVTRAGAFGGADVLVVHPWPAFLCAVSLSVGVAWVVGIPVLKLKGHYLAMATLGVGTILSSIAVGTAGLGAADGISGVPPFELVPGLRVAGQTSVRVANYYVACGLVAAAALLLLNLVHSRVGRALRAIHGAEEAAGAMGVDTARYKLRTFVLSAALAAVGGSFLTHFNAGIGPSEVSIMKSVRYVAIVAVGGMGSLWGTLAASLVLNFLSLRGYFGSLDDAVFGTILILVMLFSPDGILALDVRGALGAVLRRVRRPALPPEAAAEDVRAGEPAVPVLGGEASEEGR